MISDNRHKDYYVKAVMDIVIYSENDQDTGEIEQYKYAVEMLRQYNNHGAKAHLIMYKQAAHLGETWAEYEKRLDSESKKIAIERLTWFALHNQAFYDEHLRGIAKEMGSFLVPKKTQLELDKREYHETVKKAA
jgi:hypothetical protein